VKIARGLIVAGSVVLFLTALVHGSGYPKVSLMLEMSAIKPFLIGGFKALWIMVSTHMIILGTVFIAVSRIPNGRRIVLLCALFPALDTILLFHFIGLFIGTIFVAVATVLFLTGGFLLPKDKAA
jgi:hypothetical protein